MQVGQVQARARCLELLSTTVLDKRLTSQQRALRPSPYKVDMIYRILKSEREERQRHRNTTPEAEAKARRVEYFFMWCLSQRVEQLRKRYLMSMSAPATKQNIIESLLRDETQSFNVVPLPNTVELGRCQFAGKCRCKKLNAQDKKCLTCGHANADHLNRIKHHTPISDLSRGLTKVGVWLRGSIFKPKTTHDGTPVTK